MKYGIIFCCNLSDSKKVFTLQQKTVTVMVGIKPQSACTVLFKRLQNLFPCLYIFSLLHIIINNQEHFETTWAVYNVNTRNKLQLHGPVANLSFFRKAHMILA
jgi:hypothetical protein